MEKPNITESQLLEMVGFDPKEGGIVEIPVSKLGELLKDLYADLAVPDMIDALMEAYKAIESLDDKALGMARAFGEFEDYPVKYELIHNMRKALSKAGVNINETGDE